MAFKSQATANIGVEASPSTVTPTIAAGQTGTVIGLSLANTSASNIMVSAILNKNGGSSAYIIKSATVLAGGTLVIVGGDQKIVLEEGDTITAYCSGANSADAIISYLI